MDPHLHRRGRVMVRHVALQCCCALRQMEMGHREGWLTWEFDARGRG